MVKILSKLLTLFIFLKYPKIPAPQRWFIRFRYLGLLHQFKFFLKDHFIKKPYKVIRFQGEFQQELLHAVPFAYWHHLNGTLARTISAEHSKVFYFFSPDHVEDPSIIRSHNGNEDLSIPNAPHDTKLLKYKWKSVPFKQFYNNQHFQYNKEILVVANRFNTEWGEEPISYFDLEDLAKIFRMFQDKYQIIYNRPQPDDISLDNSEILNLGDFDFIKNEFPQVIILKELSNKVDETVSFNHLQCLVYANCLKFISIHGGTATLSSMFGGVNVIYSKKGHEHSMNEFENVFSQLSGSDIRVFKEKERMFNDLANIF